MIDKTYAYTVAAIYSPHEGEEWKDQEVASAGEPEAWLGES